METPPRQHTRFLFGPPAELLWSGLAPPTTDRAKQKALVMLGVLTMGGPVSGPVPGGSGPGPGYPNVAGVGFWTPLELSWYLVSAPRCGAAGPSPSRGERCGSGAGCGL